VSLFYFIRNNDKPTRGAVQVTPPCVPARETGWIVGTATGRRQRSGTHIVYLVRISADVQWCAYMVQDSAEAECNTTGTSRASISLWFSFDLMVRSPSPRLLTTGPSVNTLYIRAPRSTARAQEKYVMANETARLTKKKRNCRSRPVDVARWAVFLSYHANNACRIGFVRFIVFQTHVTPLPYNHGERTDPQGHCAAYILTIHTYHTKSAST
jgi:hypothetical protein